MIEILWRLGCLLYRKMSPSIMRLYTRSPGFRCLAISFRSANFRKFFQVLPYLHKVCPRVLVWTIEDQLLHKLEIAAVHLDEVAN